MSNKIYRFECDGQGIYAAVEKECPRNDPRRNGKPDGAWLPRVGSSYLGTISFWKSSGLEKYESTGLRDWHLSVVTGDTRFIVADLPTEFLYEDEWQVIFSPEHLNIQRSYRIDYQGPRPFKKTEDGRSDCIGHHGTLRDWCEYASYPQS